MSRIRKVSQYNYGRATVKVYRPDLDENERKRSEEKIIFTLKQVGKKGR